MFVRITYSNGYCGCNDTEILKIDSIENAEEYASESLHDYGESYAHVVTGFDEDFESEEDEAEYYENCIYTIEEITEKEYREHQEG